MYKKLCDYCHKKEMMVYAKDKQGTLPKAYCSKACETNAKYDKRFDERFK
jgi:hypothetical protein